MEKRRSKDAEDADIRRKIRRLEEKLTENRGRRQRSRSCSSESYDREREYEIQSCEEYSDDELGSPRSMHVVSDDEPEPELRAFNNEERTIQIEPDNKPDDADKSTLPEEILNLLGEAKKSDPGLGAKIPNEISERWGKILMDGLAKEHKEALIAKMPIPENFLLARAPKLNPEIAAVLSDPSRNRDKRLERSQNQLGASIAGLVNLTKDLINQDREFDRMEILKNLSEIGQILLDLHYEETLNRRRLLLPLLDGKFFSIKQGVKRDTYLFGDNLGENIRTSKTIEKSGLQIKKSQQQAAPRRNPAPSGNPRGPLRHQSAAAAKATPAGGVRPRDAPPAARRGQHHSAPPRYNKSSQPNRSSDRRTRR